LIRFVVHVYNLLIKKGLYIKQRNKLDDDYSSFNIYLML